MISQNDVLLARANIPVDDPIAEIWGRGLQGGYKIIEYTGALPITITANGDMLIDYRIYGADGGVGVATESGEPAGYKLPMVTRSENLFDETLNLGFYINKYFNISSSVTFARYRSMQVYLPAGTYSLMFGKTVYLVRELIDSGYSEDSFNAQIYTFQCNTDGYVGFSFRNTENTNWESDPTTVEVRRTASTPVYIGENQLDAGEYVSYGEQKIYRDVDGTLTPTDPPVPLPQIPTIDGTTIIDYDGDPKPSQMYIKYKGKG